MTDATETANDTIRRLAQENLDLQHRLNETEAQAAAWQTRANTLEVVIAAHHDTLEAQRAHLDSLATTLDRERATVDRDRDRGPNQDPWDLIPGAGCGTCGDDDRG